MKMTMFRVLNKMKKIIVVCRCHWKVIIFLIGRDNRDLDILVFKEVLENMARVDRVLTLPGGSILMAGRSGVGRRTAVTIVAHMHMMTLLTPKIGRGYGIKQFKNDLKNVS